VINRPVRGVPNTLKTCCTYLLNVGRSLRTGEAMVEVTIAPTAMSDLTSMTKTSVLIELTRVFVDWVEGRKIEDRETQMEQ
jgi:hypothetical protein